MTCKGDLVPHINSANFSDLDDKNLRRKGVLHMHKVRSKFDENFQLVLVRTPDIEPIILRSDLG